MVLVVSEVETHARGLAMLFEPYLLWQEPRVVAYQRDDVRELELLLAQSLPGTQLLYHCPGHDGRAFFEYLERLQRSVPHVRFHLMANSEAELEQYRQAFALPVAYGPASLFVNERAFTLLADEGQDTDATYVARFEPGLRDHVKRLPLAREIRSLSIVTFCLEKRWGLREPFYRTFPELSHARVNDHMLSCHQVQRELNRSRVQLALSREEGCMRAFTEGLLCGAPGVSTVCNSARREFFNDRDVLVCHDDARSVARSVSDMIARTPDRAGVRARALARLAQMRTAYVDYVARLTGASAASIDQHLFDHDEGADRLCFSLWGPSRSTPSVRRRHRLAAAIQKR
jgi:hypothetical protein